MLHRLLRRRVAPGLMGLPLVIGVAVPSALSFLDASDDLPRFELATDMLGPGDGLERYVVTVERDLPPRKPGGGRASTWSGPPTYDENISQLGGAGGVQSVVPLGGNRALVAVEEGTSARVLPFVRSAEPAATVTPLAVPAPDDPFFGHSWALHNTGSNPVSAPKVAGADVDALHAWEHSHGEGVVVAVIDNGYDHTHPDLGDALWTNPDEGCDPSVDRDANGLPGDCHGWNYYRNSGDVANVVNGVSLADHGTPVGGVIASKTGNGVGGAGLASQAKIMPVVIGGGQDLYLSYVPLAIRYAVDNGADIINMSFGISGNDPAVEAAVRYAAGKGVLMVAAAGNSYGLDRDVVPSYPVSYVLPELIGVGSSNASDGIAAHSDHGPTTVHLFAPGEEILVAYNGGAGLASGTSFAAPMTAAAAALIMAARPDLSAVEVKELLMRTAEPLAAMAGKAVSGGRLDAGRAMSTLSAPAQVSVTGLDTVHAETAGTATVHVRGTGEGLPAGELSLEVSLGAYKDGYLYAVADLPLDAGAAGAGATGQDGSLVLDPPGLTATALADGVDVPLTMTLPQGRYGLVTQLLAAGEPVTPPQAVAFLVGTPVGSGDDGGGSSGEADGGSTGGDTTGEGDSGGGDAGGDAGGSTGDSGDSGSTGGDASGGETGSDPSGSAGGDSGGTEGGGADGDSGAGDAGAGDAGVGDPGGGDAGDVGGGETGASDPGGDEAGGHETGGGETGGSTGGESGGGETGGSTGGGDAGAGGSDSGGTGGGETGGEAVRGGDADSSCGASSFSGTGTFGITSLTPNCGELAGSTTVTIYGSNLPDNPAVRVGTLAADVWPVSAPGSITFSTPARGTSGVVDVHVFAPDRAVTEMLPDAFTYLPGDSVPEGGGTDGGTGGDSGGGTDGGTDDSGGGTDGSGGGTDGGTGGDSGGSTDGSTDGSTGGDSGGGTGGDSGGSTDGSTGGDSGDSGDSTGGSTGGDSGGGATSDPRDFEGLTLVDTGGDVGGLTAAGMALLSNCGGSCFATKF